MTTGTVEPLLAVRELVQEFEIRDHGGVRGGTLQAVSGVSLEVRAGETHGVVGESGSGKSTLARSIMVAPRPKSGEVRFRGRDLLSLDRRSLWRQRQDLQMVFQDPFSSMDPRWTVAKLIEEPLVVYGRGDRAARRRRVDELLDVVGLPRTYATRRTHQLSGGQCQRVAIARAIALHPALVICDEAVSSLDVLVQAQVLNLFEDLREEMGLSYLFIAHDLALVRQVSDRITVMYLGKVCETGLGSALFRAPAHPYTVALLESIPSLEVGAAAQAPPLSGTDIPSALDPPSGCRFRSRCPRAQERCAAEEPALRQVAEGQHVACHFPLVEPSPPAAV